MISMQILTNCTKIAPEDSIRQGTATCIPVIEGKRVELWFPSEVLKADGQGQFGLVFPERKSGTEKWYAF
jgi:hypothetical protein